MQYVSVNVSAPESEAARLPTVGLRVWHRDAVLPYRSM
jgi:hypothetical protein